MVRRPTTPSGLTRIRCLAGAWLVLALAAAFPAQAGHDLTTLSLEQLMNLTVVGASKYEQKQSEVAAAVSIITRDEIRAFGWRTLDQALASLPGIHSTYDRQYSHVSARGFGMPGDMNTRMLVTINGNRINDIIFDTGPTGRDFPLDLDLIERIEFIPGPGSAVYGQNAMFGVVNVITRSGAEVAGVEVAGGGQYPQRSGEGRFTFGRRLDNGVDMLVSASGLHALDEDRFFSFGKSGISGVAYGLDGERDKEFFSRIARGPWSFEFVYGDRRKDDPSGVYVSDPLVPGQYQGDRYTLAQWQYQDSLRDDTLQVLARLFVGQNRYSSTLSYGTPFDFPAVGEWHGGELRLLSTTLKNHKLMVGLEVQETTRNDQSINDLANPANSLLISSPGNRSGLYGQDEWRISETITATLGLRLDKNDTTGSKTSPRVALIWQASPGTTWKALAGRAHRAPNANERDYYDNLALVANPALQGETINTLELVADHRVGRDLNLRGSVYRWTMRDLIMPGIDPVTGLTQFQSGDTVDARGVELSADKTWRGGSRLRGSLSFQQAGYANGTRLVNSPTWLGKLNFSAPLAVAGLRLGYEFQYDSARLTLDGSKLEGYALSHIHLGTDQLAKGLELGLSIRNLFDRRYAQPGARTNWQNALEQDGRSVYLQAIYKF